MKENRTKTINTWLNLAFDDLQSSEVLYKDGKYRASYFLFQQAVEKTGKIYAYILNMATVDSFEDIRHDQFKILRKHLVKQLGETQTKVPAVTDLSKQLKLQKEEKSLNDAIKGIDSMWNEDLVNISSKDLNELLKEFKNSFILKLDLPNKYNEEAKEMVNSFIKRMSRRKSPKAARALKPFLELVADENSFRKGYEIFVPALNRWIDSIYCSLAIYGCALITVQHSSLTRYPKERKDPLKIYTLKLPVIRKQPQFMDLLNKALSKIKKNYLTKR